MVMLDMVNGVLRRLGKNRITALDTNGSTSHAEAERIIVEQSRKLQTEGWMFNTIPTLTATPNGSGFIVVSTLATVTVLHIDGIDDEPWNNFTQRGGNLYDIDNATDVFTSAVSVRMLLELPTTDLPSAFADYVIASAAYSYNRHFVGNATRDSDLQGEILRTQAVVNKEELRSTDTNFLSNYETFSIRGRPAFQYIQGLNNA